MMFSILLLVHVLSVEKNATNYQVSWETEFVEYLREFERDHNITNIFNATAQNCCLYQGQCINDDWCNQSQDHCLNQCNPNHDKSWGPPGGSNDCCLYQDQCINDDWCNQSKNNCLGPCNPNGDKSWGPPGSGPTPSPSSCEITTLHWNAHVNRGCYGSCADQARQYIISMANYVDADIVGAIELDGASIPGYQSSGAPSANVNDASAIFVKSSFGSIVSSKPMMLVYGDGRKGGVVSKVRVTNPKGGCTYLCVAAFHIPHPGQSGSDGWRDISKAAVQSACSGVDISKCGIGIGDWNRDMGDSIPEMNNAFRFSGTSVGGPYTGTCCEGSTPDIGGYGGSSFDHTITNMRGASVSTVKVWGYPVAGDYVHNPVSMCISV